MVPVKHAYEYEMKLEESVINLESLKYRSQDIIHCSVRNQNSLNVSSKM